MKLFEAALTAGDQRNEGEVSNLKTKKEWT